MMKAYHSRLNSEDEKIRLEAAKAWSKWEVSIGVSIGRLKERTERIMGCR